MADPSPGPNVRVPPPVVYAGGYAIAWYLHRQIEFVIAGDGAGAWQVGLGYSSLAAGFALMAWAFVTMVRARTTLLPIRPARTLVTTGPFRFSRNPIYLGFAFAYVGLALVVNWAWPLVLLPAVIAMMNLVVIRREERHLQAAFGSRYEAYRTKVRRWW